MASRKKKTSKDVKFATKRKTTNLTLDKIPPDADNDRFSWRFSECVIGNNVEVSANPFCPFRYIEKNPNFVRSFIGLEQLSIKSALGDRHHYNEVKDKSAQEWLKSHNSVFERMDYIASLSLGGKMRLWGLLENGVFSILWIDPEHKIHPSPKKHT